MSEGLDSSESFSMSDLELSLSHSNMGKSNSEQETDIESNLRMSLKRVKDNSTILVRIMCSRCLCGDCEILDTSVSDVIKKKVQH